MWETILQAAMLSVLSNTIAQMVANHQENRPLSNLDLGPILVFVTYSIFNTPINVYWQGWLESTFPSSKPATPASGKDEKKQAKSSSPWPSIMAKFLLDQTVGAGFNIVLFVVGVGLLKGQSQAQITHSLQEDSWGIYIAGLKFWPAISLASFAFIPVHQRVLFGSIAGVLWGVYLSLLAK